MYKYIAAALIALGAAAMGVKYFFFSPVDTSEFKIAILLPVTHPALEEIEAAFKAEINNNCSARIEIYNAHGDRQLLATMADEIARKPYDLVCAIATQPALHMYKALQSVKKSTPLIACAVDDPVAIKLIKSAERSGTQVVAITSNERIAEQMAALDKRGIGYSRILAVHARSVNFDAAVKELKEYAAQRPNTFVTDVEVFTVAEIPLKVASVIDGHDLVVVLKDNMVVSALESVVRLCNEHHVLLYTSDLNSLQKGAAIAYGVHEAAYGTLGAQAACRILMYHEKPEEMPLFEVGGHELQINTEVFL